MPGFNIGPQSPASQILGSASLPASPTFRQIYVTSAGLYICLTDGSWTLLDVNEGDGTVTSVSIVSANGFGGTVANASTTPAITLTTSISGVLLGNGTAISASNVTNDVQTKAAVVPNTAPSSGQLLIGNAGGTAYAPVSMSGDATLASTGAITLASTITAGGPIGSATVAPIITYDAKGRLTAVSSATIAPAVGSITGLGSGVATALAVNTGSAGAVVLFNGAGGTPSSMTGTNITGTASGLTAGTASAVAVGGITGLGTGVATALAINVGSAGAFVTFNGAGGTPSSLVGTNITGTAAGLTAGVASAVAASALTGATLASNVLASSLTSLGTIASLTATAANFTSANPLPQITWTNTANYGGLLFYENATSRAGVQAMGSTFSVTARRNGLELFTAAGPINFSVDNTTTFGLSIATGNGITMLSLAGTGSRAVLADANGLLSAPVSDEMLKEPLRSLPESYGIDTVMKLRPSIFKYRDKRRFGSQDYLGFGARETAKVLPEVTGQMRDGTYYLTDEKLVVVLIKAMQQQQKEIETLKAQASP